MTTVFRLDASIRGDASVTRAIANTLETAITGAGPGTNVVRRDVAKDPVDPRVWALTQSPPQVPDHDKRAEHAEAERIAAELADEMLDADAYVFASPFYNFGVSQHVKTWADVLFGDPRFAPGEQPISGRPAYLITARGGGYGPGSPRHGWDHGTDWLRRIFGDVLGLEVQLIESELTFAPITPGMENLREMASTSLDNAHRSARELGHELAGRLRVAA